MSETSETPLITTIIPTYRRPKMLRRAIKSVLNQSYPNFQVCVYDDASGDETASVVAELSKLDSRVKYYCHPKNIGGNNNYIYGMEHVETPFFSFLSDDDILLPEFYQIAMDNFAEFPDAMFFAGTTIPMSNGGEIVNVPFPSSWQRYGYYKPPEGMLEMLGKEYGRHLLWNSILFRTEIIKNLGVIDRDTFPPSDSDFILRVAAHCPIVVSKEPCAIFVGHPSSFSDEVNQLAVYLGWLKIIRNLREDEGIQLDVRIQAEEMLTEQLKQWLFRFGLGAVIKKKFEDAYDLVDVLRDYYHLKTKSTVLYTTAKSCEYFPPAYYLLVYLNKIRVFFIQRKFQHLLGKQFGDYAQLLEL